jgi:hypothetical protein
MWLTIASWGGEYVQNETSPWLDKLSRNMSTDSISKAQKMADECINSNYQNCGW